MSKVLTFLDATLAAAVLERTKIAGNAVASRAAFIGSDIARLVPASWDGTGRVPTGYTVPYGVETEAKSTRIAIIVDDDFARNKADFVGAADALPADWNTSDDAEAKPDAGGAKATPTGAKT